MKVKVGDTVYDGAEQPVMVLLSPEDKANIAAMPEKADGYASFPDTMSQHEAEEWMQAGKDAGTLAKRCESCGGRFKTTTTECPLCKRGLGKAAG